MVKKVILLSFLVAIAAGGMWAQEGTSAKNWISGGFNTGTFITGGILVNYEYLLPVANEKFSITGQIGNRILILPQILVGARWYPWGGGNSNPETKFHIDAELGYNLGTGFAAEGALGWKFDAGSSNGFFIDLSLVGGMPVLAGIEFALGVAF
jgi:hypothetical protein